MYTFIPRVAEGLNDIKNFRFVNSVLQFVTILRRGLDSADGTFFVVNADTENNQSDYLGHGRLRRLIQLETTLPLETTSCLHW